MSTTVYTAPAKPESVRSRAGRSRWWILGIGLILLFAIIIALSARPTDYRPLSIDNTTDSGSRAVAQILRGQGATVRQYERLASVRISDTANTTLVIAGGEVLTESQIDSVLAYEGDILFIGASSELMSAIDPSLDVSYDFLPETVRAACDDPDASAAETSRVIYTAIVPVGPTDAALCFENRSSAFGMAVVDTASGTRTVVANSQVYSNSELLTAGHAALALRTTGHHKNVAWYLADYYDPTMLAEPGEPVDFESMPDFLPPGFGTALYALGLAVLIMGLWRGRRFGPLVVEPLPVVVRASEATRGRARLYRRARAYGRASAALRAAAARRMGARLGIPRTTEREGMVAAIERATGRSPHDIARILYGPPPASEAAMMELIDQLDALEGEVHGT